jgi:hypothetical protein
VPGKPYVVFNTRAPNNSTTTTTTTSSGVQWSGKDMVISFSAPCSGLIHQAITLSESPSSHLVGSVILPEVRLDSGAKGYCTNHAALGNKTCFVFYDDGAGVLVVLCQYAISEPRLEEWFGVVLSAFKPKSLHILEDVPVSNLLKNRDEISQGGEGGGGIQVITSGPSPLVASSSSVGSSCTKMSIWPDLEQAVCSQVFSEVSRILKDLKTEEVVDTYHPVAIVHGHETRMTLACIEGISECFKPLLEMMAGGANASSSSATTLRRQGIEHLHEEFVKATKTNTPSSHASIYV